MSSKPKDRRPTDLVVKQEDKIRMNLANIIDNINNNNLTYFYPKDESLFKKRIDKLNLKFYIETEKYVTNKNDVERCQDQLFIILFKQISLYIEEVERLNFLIREKQEDEKTFKEKIEEMQKREKEKSTTQILINNLRSLNKNLEKKIEEKNRIENNLKSENISLQRQIKFYQEKLQIDLKKSHDIYNNKKRTFEEFLTTPNINSSNNIISNNNDSINTNFRSESKESNSGLKLGIMNANYHSGSFNINDFESHNSNTSLIVALPSTISKSFFKNGANSTNTVTTSNKTPNENLTISKILNKKRNYSDNNPNQVKKGFNIVSVSVNNRYGENTANQISLGSNTNTNNINEEFKRQMTKSTVVHKNSNVKSPQRNGDSKENENLPVITNNAVSSPIMYNGNFIKKSSDNNKLLSKNISKNYKDLKIIKSIKINNKTDKSDKIDKNYQEIVKSPKNKLLPDLNIDKINNFSSNENLFSDQHLLSLENEINYLDDLEKMVNNLKLLFNDEEINKRSDNDEQTNTQLFAFSDDENDGYKTGSSNGYSEKQYVFNNKILYDSKNNITTMTNKSGKLKSFPSVTIDLINFTEKGSKNKNTKSNNKNKK